LDLALGVFECFHLATGLASGIAQDTLKKEKKKNLSAYLANLDNVY